jgi:hypothetical protein
MGIEHYLVCVLKLRLIIIIYICKKATKRLSKLSLS